MTTTETMLQEIRSKECTRLDVAKTYALALRSTAKTDWGTVNRAILQRWSWILAQAWSGECFDDPKWHAPLHPREKNKEN